jgi:(p)ppGpp synthase/HD superfamily hydrolase
MEEQRATLEDAIILAAQSHRGQKDKAGAPYITHPLRVLGFLGVGASEDEQITAVLHDVVEDCGVSFEDLTRAGYSTEVIEALRCVTKLPTRQTIMRRSWRGWLPTQPRAASSWPTCRTT